MNKQPKKHLLLILSLLATILTSSTALAKYDANGVVNSNSGEECDDGNRDNDDGCNEDGELESINACDANGDNCINIAVFTPLAGNVSNKPGQVIAGLYRPAETNPPADYDTTAQSFTISVVDTNGAVVCKQDFDETDTSQAMVRPLWAFKCDQQITTGSTVRVTHSGTETDASWSYKDPVKAGVTVTSPADLLIRYNKANCTVVLTDNDRAIASPDSIESMEGGYWWDAPDGKIKMYLYRTTQGRNLEKTVSGVSWYGSILVESSANKWSLKNAVQMFLTSLGYYQSDEQGVFFFQPYYEKLGAGSVQEIMVSSGTIAIRDLDPPTRVAVGFHSDTRLISGFVFDENNNGESFATVNITFETLNGKLKPQNPPVETTYTTVTGPDGRLNYTIGSKAPDPGYYRITVSATDRAGNKCDPSQEAVFIWPIPGPVGLDAPVVNGAEVVLSGKTAITRQRFDISVKKKGDASAPNLVAGGSVFAGDNNAPDDKHWKLTLSDIAPGTYIVEITVEGQTPVTNEFTIPERITEATVEGHTLSVSGLVTDGGSTFDVKITKEGQDVKTESVTANTAGAWHITFDLTGLLPGDYKVIVRGVEKAFTIEPRIDEATVSDNTLTASGLAGADSQIDLKITKGGQNVKTEQVSTDASGAWQTTVDLTGLLPGDYKVVVDGTEKSFTIAPKINEATVEGKTLTVSGLAAANKPIELKITKDGQEVKSKSVPVNDSSVWRTTINLTGLAPGDYKVTIGGVEKAFTIPQPNPDDGNDTNGGTQGGAGNGGDGANGDQSDDSSSSKSKSGGCSSTDGDASLLTLLLASLGLVAIRRRRRR